MITIYNSKETNFNNNGLAILNEASSCIITEELNGLYECTLEYPMLSSQGQRYGTITPSPKRIVGRHKVGELGYSDINPKWHYLIEDNIVKADGQLFRIYNKSKTTNSIKVNCRHIFYDLLDNFIEEAKIENLSCVNALYYLMTKTQFKHSFITSGDITTVINTSYEFKNPVECILGDEGLIANLPSGELLRDNFDIKLLTSRGTDNGVLISYGKNIMGIEETLDMSDVCTRMIPIGKDKLKYSGKYVDSPYINNYPHPKIKMIEFNDIEEDSKLKNAAVEYFKNSKIDIPKFNYKIDFIELSKTEEYKNYVQLETVNLGDIVTIKHTKMNINLKAKVIKLSKNDLTNRIESVELGQFKSRLSNKFSSIDRKIQATQNSVIQTNESIKNTESKIDETNSQLALKVSFDDYTGTKMAQILNQTKRSLNPGVLDLDLSGFLSLDALGKGTINIKVSDISTNILSAKSVTAPTITSDSLTLGGTVVGSISVKNASGVEILKSTASGLLLPSPGSKVTAYDNTSKAFMMQTGVRVESISDPSIYSYYVNGAIKMTSGGVDFFIVNTSGVQTNNLSGMTDPNVINIGNSGCRIEVGGGAFRIKDAMGNYLRVTNTGGLVFHKITGTTVTLA